MGHIEKFGHGGDLLTASTAFGVEKEKLIDFSANINPLGPPPRVLERIKEEMKHMVHYPDPAHRSLTALLAAKYGVEKEMLIVGNGAAECISLVLLAFAPKKVGVIYPSFLEYKQLAEAFGASVHGCTGQAEKEFLPDPDELYPLFEAVDMVFIGHPNNPTGMMYDMDALVRMADWAEQLHTYMVVDEAFLDFLPPDRQVTLIRHLHRYSSVILLRSMTKFYAIPGLRLGFSIGPASLIQKMKQKQVPWSVNGLALAAGEACCADPEYERKTRELIAGERSYLSRRIRESFGWHVWPGQANFLLIRLHPHQTAGDLQLKLGKKGIMIRSCAMYTGLTERDFRIAVRSREDNDRLLDALAGIAEEGEGC
jgi:threonine-phosphate decarboxylase